METVVDLEPEALERAKALADERGQTLGKVLSDVLLGRSDEQGTPEGYPKVVRGPTGLPEIHLGRPFRMEEVREAIEDED